MAHLVLQCCPPPDALLALTRLANRLRSIPFSALLLSIALARPGSVHGESLPTIGMLSLETVRLPEHERMGLVGGTLLFDAGADWWLGPAVYGAVSGHRGGFFVGGLEVQRRWSLSPGLNLATGLYAGGGGGAAAPVGGGLMLRPAVTLLKDIGPSWQLGLSWSLLRFPSGQIDSQQIGVTMAWRSEFIHFDDSGHGGAAGQATGLGFDRMAATASSYRLDGGSRRIALAGARAERRASDSGFGWGIEAAAAAKGDAAGYLEVLGTAAFSVAPAPSAWPGWRVGVRGGIGAGGGGAVPTGGGLMGKIAGTLEGRIAPGWTAGAEIGEARSANGNLHARLAQVWLGMSLEPGLDGRAETDTRAVRSEWVAAWQHHARVARTDGSQHPLDTIGLKLDRYLNDHVYLSGQAHSAFAGGAGAYSIGLVGVGLAAQPAADWRIGAELLAGAAGGGGVQTGGGAIVQGVTWAGWAPDPRSTWRAGLGMVRSVRGGAQSPLVELSWSRAFGMAGR
jgi:hypothetical protein